MIPDELAVYVAKLKISDSHTEKSFYMYSGSRKLLRIFNISVIAKFFWSYRG